MFDEAKKFGDPSMRMPLIEEEKQYNYLPKTKVLPTEGEQELNAERISQLIYQVRQRV